MGWNEDVDASSDAGLSFDEAVAFEAENHLMDRRRADAKVALHVGLSRRLTEDALVDTDEDEIVTLLFGETMRADAARGA